MNQRQGWRERAASGKWQWEPELPDHRVRVYVNRIAVSRKDGSRLTWEELQDVKNEVLGSNAIAVEVYPPNYETVNLAHTRHLWFSPMITQIVKDQCRHPEFFNA